MCVVLSWVVETKHNAQQYTPNTIMKILIPKSPEARMAEAYLGGPVRMIDMNASLREKTYALASEAQGYPVNWKITKMYTSTSTSTL
jgi:hypothetical protein